MFNLFFSKLSVRIQTKIEENYEFRSEREREGQGGGGDGSGVMA
jgi:hypothetical protein